MLKNNAATGTGCTLANHYYSMSKETQFRGFMFRQVVQRHKLGKVGILTAI